MTDPSTTAVSPPRFALGDGQAAFEVACDRAREEDWATRLFDRDTSLWSDDPGVQETIAQRLGWLDAADHFTDRIAALEGFGDGIVAAGFTTAIVAGMGGNAGTQTLAVVVRALATNQLTDTNTWRMILREAAIACANVP